MKTHVITATIITIVIGLTGVLAGIDFKKMHKSEPLYPGEGMTGRGMLSDYFEGIKGTHGDTEVFFFDSGKPGGTVFIAGGTHPNEPAGYMAAVVILENMVPETGRIIIIPRLNNSGFTCNDPMEAFPQSFSIQTEGGMRKFRFGSRGTNPLDQWPDPLVYTHRQSGQQYSGFDSRNLNRTYPGVPNGTLTEKVAYAIVSLIREEKVDLAFDLHEAAPEIPIINALVYHEKAEEIVLYAVLELEAEGLTYAPELSPANFHGLSHREWGDYTGTNPVLMETSSPAQGRLRGKTNEALILDGISSNYQEAKATGVLRIEYREEGEQLDHRVGRHLAGFRAILNSYNEIHPENAVDVSGVPDYQELTENGIGKYLRSPI